MTETRELARMRILVGCVIAAASLLVGVTNIIGAPARFDGRPLRLLLSPHVSVLVVSAVVALGSVVSPRLRIVQVIILLANGYVGAILNAPGNLTSLLFVLLGLFLSNEYGYFASRAARRSVALMGVYLLLRLVAAPARHDATALQTAATVLGTAGVGALSWAVIVLRDRDRTRRQRELESKVAERTAELSKALADQKLLLAEIHHRTKNNLQLVSSILSLGKQTQPGPATGQAIKSGQLRINALGRMHDQLYAETSSGRTDLTEFLENYLTDAQMMAGSSRCDISWELSVSRSVSVELAIRLALVLNEIVTEAVEHAAESDRQLALSVRTVEHDERLTLETSDDAPAGPDRTTGTTVDIVRAMVQRVGGEATVSTDDGLHWWITFPVEFGLHSLD